ncbi:MAG TPA: hypothetical protein VM184_10665, partial [Gaiellaceae bacterium]|nr:hypothetical protein [Gaiellaceae bacterium]
MRAIRQHALLLLAIGAVAMLTGSAAQAAGESVLFLRAPSIALQGKAVTVVAAAKPAGDLCMLRVRYADGVVQTIGRALALRGRASWTWRIPDVAKPGRATLTASCPRAGRRTRSVTVVGNLVPPAIVVENEGFSVRPKSTGSSVSYGLLLKNLSPNADALRVYVLVNFVMADGHVLGTATRTVEAVAAGATYAYGGSLNFPGAAPIVQLEIVIKVDGRQRHSLRTPVVDNVR